MIRYDEDGRVDRSQWPLESTHRAAWWCDTAYELADALDAANALLRADASLQQQYGAAIQDELAALKAENDRLKSEIRAGHRPIGIVGLSDDELADALKDGT